MGEINISNSEWYIMECLWEESHTVMGKHFDDGVQNIYLAVSLKNFGKKDGKYKTLETRNGFAQISMTLDKENKWKLKDYKFAWDIGNRSEAPVDKDLSAIQEELSEVNGKMNR